MDTSEGKIKRIQKFIDAELSDADFKAIKSQELDAEFKQEILMHSRIVDQLSVIDRLNTTRYLQHSTQSKKPWYWLGVVLLLLLILMSILLYFSSIDDESPVPLAELSQKYFIEYPIDSGTRGNRKVTIEDAFLHYAQKDLDKALAIFNKLEQTEQIEMYKGNIYFQQSQFQNATVSFKKLLQSEDKKIRENAEWYYCISLLASQNLIGSKKILMNIINQKSHAFQKVAIQLDNELAD